MNSRHASRAAAERPPAALLITSPSAIEARYRRKRSTAATTVDGSVRPEMHEHEAAPDLLPHQHLMEMGEVDAEVRAENQLR